MFHQVVHHFQAQPPTLELSESSQGTWYFKNFPNVGLGQFTVYMVASLIIPEPLLVVRPPIASTFPSY